MEEVHVEPFPETNAFAKLSAMSSMDTKTIIQSFTQVSMLDPTEKHAVAIKKIRKMYEDKYYWNYDIYPNKIME